MSIDFLSLAVSDVQKLAPYVPGKPIEELERETGLAAGEITSWLAMRHRWLSIHGLSQRLKGNSKTSPDIRMGTVFGLRQRLAIVLAWHLMASHSVMVPMTFS